MIDSIIEKQWFYDKESIFREVCFHTEYSLHFWTLRAWRALAWILFRTTTHPGLPIEALHQLKNCWSLLMHWVWKS